VAEIVGGIAVGCEKAGCALVGGETAEHPGLMADDHYDIAGTGVGVVEADAVLGADRVVEGDVVIAMESSGVHSNGFSLVRHVLLNGARMRLDAHVDELGMSLGESLLTPTKIYAKDCLAVIAETDVHAFSHVTGGGLAANLARVLPEHLTARLQRGSWTPPAIFDLVQARGRVEQAEMDRTFNMGVGMVAIVPAADVDRTMALLKARHVESWVLGELVPGDGSAVLEGSHA
jgi:phosphoribosylformylglycinamidine cyclo-ligase